MGLAGALLLTNLIGCSLELAFIDGLTGIPGRRALENEMKHLGRRYSLAMMDVDHFKSFNDTYGHNMGDDVLKLVASIMGKHCGMGAKVYRYGGEEFTLLFKGRRAQDCVADLDELRQAIADYPLSVREYAERGPDDTKGKQKRGQGVTMEPVHVTISIGVADHSAANTPQAVMKVADQLLYQAKKAGRNQVICR
nr:GGDEF domain-containing protein [Shewanella sp. NIFS-20-20]